MNCPRKSHNVPSAPGVILKLLKLKGKRCNDEIRVIEFWKWAVMTFRYERGLEMFEMEEEFGEG